MRRVPSCLLSAFALSLAVSHAGGALAGPGAGHGPVAHRSWGGHTGFNRAWGGHAGFNRGHWSGPRLGARWGYARHAQPFRGKGYPFYGSAFYPFAGYSYSPYGYGQYGYRPQWGRSFYKGYGHHEYGCPFYGDHGYGRHFYGYGRPFYGVHGYGRGYGSFRHGVWSYLDTSGDVTMPIIQADAPPPLPPAIPSVADLPVAMGIRSAPPASPAVYVLSPGRQSLRGRGGQIADTDAAEGEDLSSGPRIIRLDVPRGR
jgi:hypothetical protein